MASVKLLLDSGADVHALNKWRETPLLTAANHGQSTAVEALLANGADPCKCTDTGWSPLSIAAYKGHDEVVRMLLEEGAPTEEDDPTLSALLQAATKGLPDTVELLLRHGADHTVTTKKGDTALSILVEQNLIDAAVDMVMEYNASIPRCSRDRKKVQRARLLINHKMKQMERTGRSLSSEDEESHAEPDEKDENNEAQHSPNNAQASGGKGGKKKKGKNKGMSAEEKAKAAEEALLLELEQEEAVAKKEEAEASKKQAKRKKKKERERQQKMKEEQEKKEKEEREEKERERIRREREERERKERAERERKMKEQQEAEMKEHLAKEKAMAAKKKEKEQKDKREKELQQRKQEKSKPANPASPSGSSTSTETRAKNQKAKKPGTAASVPGTPTSLAPSPVIKKNVAAPVAPGSNRRWENKAKMNPQPATDPATPKQRAPSPGVTRNGVQRAASGSSAGSAPRQTPANAKAPATQITPPKSQMRQLQNTPAPAQGTTYQIEHPTIALHRKEKVADLLRNAASVVQVVDHYTVKRAMWRWIVRAAHSSGASLDPLIPSAANPGDLTGFFQRQFISEVRRRSTQGFPINMEELKEAGSALADMCQNVAKDMSHFRQTINDQLASSDWDDAQAGMRYDVQNGTANVVRVAWANRAEVTMPVETLGNLRERFTGNHSRFLAAVFAAKVWDETKRLIVDKTDMDIRLAPSTQICLSSDLAVSAELYSDPFTVGRGHFFWSSFENIDTFFGGQPPFGASTGAAETLLRHGGSVAGVLPSDSFVAQQYLREVLNAMDTATVRGAPVSFALFVTDESISDPCDADLGLVDPRLRDNRGMYIMRKEFLRAGHHTFISGEGVAQVAPKDSMLLILQNEPGRARYCLTEAAIGSIAQSMSVASTQPLAPAMAFRPGFGVPRESPLSSPTPYFDPMMSQRPLENPSPGSQLYVPTDFGPISGTSIASKPFSPSGDNPSRGARRGRLFDLVDDVEEDNSNDVDIVSGMLNNLDVGLFQSNSASSEIDIEAISLMGIGGGSLSLPPRNSNAGAFGS